MSTFSGLNTAYSGLTAARVGLDIVGQNITNATTDGYTRQRVPTTAMGATAHTTLSDGGIKVGQGVSVDTIDRLGNTFMDAQVRNTAAQSGYAQVHADAYSSIESGLNEPGASGLSSQLQKFWASWSDVSNQPGETAPAAILIQNAASLTATLSAGYTNLSDQWNSVRSSADTQVSEVNNAAAQVATLNDKIRAATASGANPNELVDQRNKITTTLSSLVGGTVRDLPDGTNEVLLGGNVLVSGSTSNQVAVSGASSMADGTGVQLEWARHPATPITMDSGSLAASLSVLAPARADGNGGAFAQAADSYNRVASSLAAAVNTVHETGTVGDGTTGHDFFSVGTPAATTLKTLVGTASDIAAGTGAKDGSVADKISQIAGIAGGPDKTWSDFVVTTGVNSKAALQQSVLSDNAHTSAVTNQQSVASVDLDEENMNMLQYQHAYQAAARVMTAVDETLDVLINQTGRVGR